MSTASRTRTRTPLAGCNGSPLFFGDTVLVADPDNDDLARCGTFDRMNGRFVVWASGGDVLFVTPTDCQKV